MELKRYFNIIVHWWWLVLSSFLIVTVAGFVFSFSQSPQYQSSITLIVSPKASITELSAVRQSLDTLDNPSILNTYAEIIRSQHVLQQAKQGINMPESASQQVTILVTVIQKTNLIKVEAQGTNPTLVYNLVNAVADQSIGYVNNLYEIYEIKVLDAAVPPLKPFSPDVLRDTLLAAAVGLMFGVTASFFAEYIQRPLEAFEALSIIDRETGLYNKRYFLQRLKEESNRAKRNKRLLAACLITLQPVESSQENYSRQTLQMIRRRVTAYLKRHIRQDELLARWDHDKFAWLLLDTSEAAARQAIERLTGVLETKVFEDEETGATFTFGGNFGVVVSNGETTEKDLMEQAEQSLRQVKPYGQHGIQVISASADMKSV